jgi:hypothetical protein
MPHAYENDPKYPFAKQNSADSFMNEPANPYVGATPLKPYTSQSHRPLRSIESRENLVENAAPLGGGSPPREPRLPDLSGHMYKGYRGIAC